VSSAEDASTEQPPDAADASNEAATAAALGRACESDADCSGLVCIRASSDFGPVGTGSPPHGYCTRDCRNQKSTVDMPSSDICAPLEGTCLHFGSFAAWCIAYCTQGNGPKCQQRFDTGCALVNVAVLQTLCLPQCATDADCGTRRCDESTGLCVDMPARRDPDYSGCVVGVRNETCNGFCLPFDDVRPGQTAPGVCSRDCVIGAPDACGRKLGLPLSSGQVGDCAGGNDSGPGDFGRCLQLCDTVADCRNKTPGVVCDMMYQGQFGHGFCAPPLVVDAGAPVPDAATAD
jgi:hypothetical protein